jgi:hypothetical protein
VKYKQNNYQKLIRIMTKLNDAFQPLFSILISMDSKFEKMFDYDVYLGYKSNANDIEGKVPRTMTRQVVYTSESNGEQNDQNSPNGGGIITNVQKVQVYSTLSIIPTFTLITRYSLIVIGLYAELYLQELALIEENSQYLSTLDNDFIAFFQQTNLNPLIIINIVGELCFYAGDDSLYYSAQLAGLLGCFRPFVDYYLANTNK